MLAMAGIRNNSQRTLVSRLAALCASFTQRETVLNETKEAKARGIQIKSAFKPRCSLTALGYSETQPNLTCHTIKWQGLISLEKLDAKEVISKI